MTKPQDSREPDWAPKFVQDLRGEAHAAIAAAESQVHDFIARLVERGHATQDEATGAFRETFKRLRKNREEMTHFVEERLGAMRKLVRLPSRREVDELQRRVASLRARLDRVDAALNKKH
jgi:polyhydroxyalkanoate synthesis regulator phasin